MNGQLQPQINVRASNSNKPELGILGGAACRNPVEVELPLAGSEAAMFRVHRWQPMPCGLRYVVRSRSLDLLVEFADFRMLTQLDFDVSKDGAHIFFRCGAFNDDDEFRFV